MRWIFWTLGCLAFSLCLVTGLFELFTYVSQGAWQPTTLAALWGNLAPAIGPQGSEVTSLSLDQLLASFLPNTEWKQSVETYVIHPVAAAPFIFVIGALGLILLYLGRYREPDLY